MSILTSYNVQLIVFLLFLNTVFVRNQDVLKQPIGDKKDTLLSITLQHFNEAANEGLQNVDNIIQLERELKRKGLVTRPGSAAFFHQAIFRGYPEKLATMKWNGQVAIETAKSLIKKLNFPVLSIDEELHKISLGNSVLQDFCPKPPICAPTKYRSIDGSCNNLENNSWGKSYRAYKRLLPPQYDDGIDTPRQTSVDGGPLPNPRLISTTYSPDFDRPSRYYTALLMQWGQFLDHDITSTALTSGGHITCCNEEIRRNESLRHPACLPFDIPSDDPFYAAYGETCMEFVRSLAAPVENCRLGQRQQLNEITGFIDASQVYGSTFNHSQDLRSFEGGKLKSSPTYGGNVLPPDPETKDCGAPKDGPPCVLAGDIRANEQTFLTVSQQLWFREHNRITGILSRINKEWNDEVLYQEARRIVGAMMQHITYNEFLPILFGSRLVTSLKLNVKRSGYSFDYDRNVDPTLSNVFATAAYRFGHTLVQGDIPLVSSDNEVSDRLSLASQYLSPVVIYDETAFDMMVRGLTATSSQSFDSYFTDQLTNHLFQQRGQKFGLDLVAINVQRGRDHGTPPYTDWREYCKLPAVTNFDDLSEVINSEAAEILRGLYRNVQDIDLYIAGLSEKSFATDALLPPTFACLVAEQFRRLKVGDRYWYENGHMESSFSESQLKEIRKVTLARVLCDNSNIASVQKYAMLISGPRNPIEPCIQGNIPRMSLDPWKIKPAGV